MQIIELLFNAKQAVNFNGETLNTEKRACFLVFVFFLFFLLADRKTRVRISPSYSRVAFVFLQRSSLSLFSFNFVHFLKSDTDYHIFFCLLSHFTMFQQLCTQTFLDWLLFLFLFIYLPNRQWVRYCLKIIFNLNFVVLHNAGSFLQGF